MSTVRGNRCRAGALATALLAALAVSACRSDDAARGGAARPPNVVVVVVDDLRWDDIAVAGHPWVETPHIDQLAREGARFLNAFATTPLCSPSRASILTGQYAHTHGITDNTARDSASHRLATFAVPLAAAGYETAFLGKWHMGNDDTRRPGFTHWVAMKGQGEAIDPKLNVDGARIERTGYVTDILTEYALAFMRRARGKPFMLFLAHKALHPNIVQRDDGSTAQVVGQASGFIPAERHRGRYATRVVPRRANAHEPLARKPALQRKLDGLPPLGPGTGTSDREVRERLEMLLGVDESLGRIVETLRTMGELDNTVIVFTSDHGYFYGEHGLGEERRLAYEETARIPLIVRYPRLVAAGSTPAQMVQTIDLAPTVLALAGVSDTVTRHGTSLLPVLDGSARSWRSSVLIEYYSDRVFPRIRNMGYQAVRTERYKYIEYSDLRGMDELYDLERDPFELDNIIASDRGRAVLPQVRLELARLQRETGFAPVVPVKAPAGMAWIPGGRFLMGDDGRYADPAERPVHPVQVDAFFMDVHAVTNAQFRAFVNATGYVTVAERAPNEEEILRQLPPGTPRPDPRQLVAGSLVFAPTTRHVDLRDWSQWWRWTPGANWRHPEGPGSSIQGKDGYPVVQVAWADAMAYAAWLGRRLPTEAEWEFAARGGQAHADHAWGDAPYDAAHPQADIYEGTFPTHAAAPKPVGSYAPNAFGLYDMAGNVWQWTLDWYRPDTYALDKARGVVSNPTGPAAGLDPRDGFEATKVVRGGSFLCSDSYCRGYRLSARNPGAPDTGTSHIGFRTVMTVEQWTQRHGAR